MNVSGFRAKIKLNFIFEIINQNDFQNIPTRFQKRELTPNEGPQPLLEVFTSFMNSFRQRDATGASPNIADVARIYNQQSKTNLNGN